MIFRKLKISKIKVRTENTIYFDILHFESDYFDENVEYYTERNERYRLYSHFRRFSRFQSVKYQSIFYFCF
jgi:hypothetical protein